MTRPHTLRVMPKSTSLIVDLAELVLKNNNFEFNGNHYLQTLGRRLILKWTTDFVCPS